MKGLSVLQPGRFLKMSKRHRNLKNICNIIGFLSEGLCYFYFSISNGFVPVVLYIAEIVKHLENLGDLPVFLPF